MLAERDDDADDFSISGGVLTFATSPDYEDPADADTNTVYLVTIEASDGLSNTVTPSRNGHRHRRE